MRREFVYLALVLGLVLQPASAQQQPVFTATVSKEPIAPDGTQIQCDLPVSLHMKNTGGSDGPRGPGSGSGLCVFTSINMAAFFQNVEALFNFQKWMTNYPGGGYPGKVDKMIEQICHDQHCDKPEYVQVEESTLRTIKLALKTGRPVSVTYCYSPSGRYGGARIAHMVSVFHCDDKWVCVIDNNFPGTYEWMTPEEFLKCSRCNGGNLWVVVLLNPGPPPPPIN